MVPTDRESSNGSRKKLTPEQKVALRSLRNVLVDFGVRQDGQMKVAKGKWDDQHMRDAPDYTPSQRRDHRRQLENKGWVVTHDLKSWVINDLDENVG